MIDMKIIYPQGFFKIVFGVIIFLLGISINAAFSGDFFRRDPDIAGKILDFDTKKPIPGVVVMAMWSTDKFRLTIEPKSEYYDYSETLSNKVGEFRIPGKGLIIFRNINPPKIKTFKIGYPSLSLGHYDNYLGKSYLELHPNSHYVEWINGHLIISIRKKSIEERKKSIREYRQAPFYGMGYVPSERFRLYTEELRREYKAVGRPPPWERNQLYLQYKPGGVYPAGEAAVKAEKIE